jgi:hypothetical protein
MPLDVDAAHVAVIRAHVANCRHAGKVEVTLPRASLEVLLKLFDAHELLKDHRGIDDWPDGGGPDQTRRQASEHSELGKLQAATTSPVDGRR